MATDDRSAAQRLCIGFGDREGVCENPAGSSHSELWCQGCDDERMKYLSAQFEKIKAKFEESPWRRSL